jgi:putative PIN family toxin of toxin-antitoxin system
MRVNRFVLDANIWVSYLITEAEQKLIDIIVDNDLVVFRCEELLEEIARVLNYSRLKKYNVDIPYALRIVRKATAPCKLIYPIKRYIPSDKDDDYLVALALQTSSGFITSGDSNILEEKTRLEKKFKKLKIITKAEFEKKFIK